MAALQRETNEAIGAFVFAFSQLEFTIKVRLGRVLELDDDLFDIVTGPYDFAMLCVVTREAMLKQKNVSPARRKKVKEFFKDCLGFNSSNRLIVAHALWTVGGASHVSRSNLQRKLHFTDLDELRQQTRKAEALMSRIFAEGI